MNDWNLFDEVIIEKNSDIYVVFAVDNNTGKKYQIQMEDSQRWGIPDSNNAYFIEQKKVCHILQKNGNNLLYNGENHEEMFNEISEKVNQAHVRTYSINCSGNIYNNR
ncbi:hypothetical protein BA71_02144 [Acinetobacter baumannii LAC-4]|uniref:hypothetical protein n=1 Tax=Acinetobacter baumannii TaxID=470 RepID=UPI00044EEE37|nr:hypothetical protein [Acinetobacter baumannii]AIY36964.1 hypothetical protein ABLAC_16090 [Acinetobacter baumannii LAC-4]APO59509.1 hypothetical protein BBX32_13645 [Acinetobacter baumannii]EZF15071.1 hypothetical protein BA71_02144 [Acinetobacter baumannii LAC-4]